MRTQLAVVAALAAIALGSGCCPFKKKPAQAAAPAAMPYCMPACPDPCASPTYGVNYGSVSAPMCCPSY
ncbi:MAG: hypothetical protein KF688_11895 [Pirellulales bacterium]|nr:hypothetical protein [Pirellulales bacterium]